MRRLCLCLPVLLGPALSHATSFTVSIDSTTVATWNPQYPVTLEFQTSATIALVDGVQLRTLDDVGEDGSEGVSFGGSGMLVSIVPDTTARVIEFQHDGCGGIQDMPATFLGVASMWDAKEVAVVFTGDDWCGFTEDKFVEASVAARSRGIWFTPGITPEGLWCWGDSAAARADIDWNKLQQQVNLGFVEPAVHGLRHIHQPYDETDDPPDCAYEVTSSYSEEIRESHDVIAANLMMPSLSGGRLNVWIEPYGQFTTTAQDTIAAVGYLVDRSTVQADYNFAAFDTTRFMFERTGVAEILETETLTVLNSRYDHALNNETNGIYHLMSHPRTIDFSPGSIAAQHLDYIAKRPEAWYVGAGHMYIYRLYLEPGVVTVQEVVS